MLRFLTIFLSIALLGNAGAATLGQYTYEINSDNGSVSITDYPTDAIGAIEIPATIDGRSVTIIGENAFYQCSSLTSITIPDSVTSIGGGAFYGCTSLTSIDIPDSVTYIGQHTFRGCTSLTSINIPGVIIIGNSAFEDCTSLTSINIPDSVTTIRSSAFSGCTSLTSGSGGHGVTSIEHSAFSGCTSMTSIIIPDSVTSIKHSVFSGCTGLTSITIPDSVNSIEHNTFSGCTSLTSIVIPDSVKSIGESAFDGCTNLASIRLESMAAPAIRELAFGGISATAMIYYRQGATGYETSYGGVPTLEDNFAYSTDFTAGEVATAAATAVATAIKQAQQDVIAAPASFSLQTMATVKAELIDMRTGSTMLNMVGSNAVLQLQIQRSDDLNTWTSSSDDLIEVKLPMQQGKGFYRFAMPQE